MGNRCPAPHRKYESRRDPIPMQLGGAPQDRGHERRQSLAQPTAPRMLRPLPPLSSVMPRDDHRCLVPLVSGPFDLSFYLVELLHALIDVESVSGNETRIADLV